MSIAEYVKSLDAERDALMEKIKAENLPLACETLAPKRKYKVWKTIDEDERQYLRQYRQRLISKDPTLEADPELSDAELFAPRMVLGLNVEKLNAEVDAFIGKYGRLPRNVTKWNASAPTNEQLKPAKNPKLNLSKLTTVRADKVVSKAVKWLWEGRIPLSKLSVLAGNPDQGKSLVSLYLVAHTSTGQPFFDSPQMMPPGDVLIMAAEDEADDTIKPRLEAAGADLSRVHILQSVMLRDGQGKDIGTRELQLDTDLQAIERELEDNPAIRLLVIDPISSFLGNTSMNKEQDVRRVLTPLKNLAARRNIAVVAVMHLNKVGDQSAIHRIGGAVAFTGVARAVWMFAGDEENPDIHLMLRVKNNIADPKKSSGLKYKIPAKPIHIEGQQIYMPYIEWVGKTDSNADAIFGKQKTGRPEKVTSATEWLKEFLSQGDETQTDVERFGVKKGFSTATLRRAKTELNITSVQVGRRWFWRMPKAQEQETKV